MAKTKRTAVTAAFGEIIPTTMDPRVFKKIESLCVAALQYSANPQVRQAVVSLNLEMCLLADSRHGHKTVDCTTLGQLLKRTDPDKPIHQAPAPQRDPMDVLEKMGVIYPSHVSAGEVMREVWTAFGRCLTVSGRGHGGGGVLRRSSALQPMDVMGQETWDIYKDCYKPWQDRAMARTVPCKDTGNTTAFRIVYAVVIDEHFPNSVDNFMQLEPGKALSVLKHELGHFFDNYDSGPREDKVLPGPGMVYSPPKVAAA